MDGTLKISEIDEIIEQNGVKPKVDDKAAIAYFSWDKTNWYAFVETLLDRDVLTGE